MGTILIFPHARLSRESSDKGKIELEVLKEKCPFWEGPDLKKMFY